MFAHLRNLACNTYFYENACQTATPEQKAHLDTWIKELNGGEPDAPPERTLGKSDFAASSNLSDGASSEGEGEMARDSSPSGPSLFLPSAVAAWPSESF
eukprot:37992-Pyramimonas_sp.AAC.1